MATADEEFMQFTQLEVDEFYSHPGAGFRSLLALLISSAGDERFRPLKSRPSFVSRQIVEKPGITLQVRSGGLVDFLSPCCWAKFTSTPKRTRCSSCNRLLLRQGMLPTAAHVLPATGVSPIRRPRSYRESLADVLLLWCEAMYDPLSAVVVAQEVQIATENVAHELDEQLAAREVARDLAQKKEKEAKKKKRLGKQRERFAEEFSSYLREKPGGEALLPHVQTFVDERR